MKAIKLGTRTLLLILSWSTPGSALAQPTDCMINQADSLVQIFVLKQGPLSMFGDNHIISTTNLVSQIRFDPKKPENSKINLTIPVNSFVVNDPALRARASEEFRSKVSNFNRRITRKSMLGPKVLDVENYPEILIAFEKISGDLPDLDVDLIVTLHGQRKPERSSINIAYDDLRMVTTGELTISQKRYGIKPFAILFGAIRVQDGLRLKFDIAADCG